MYVVLVIDRTNRTEEMYGIFSSRMLAMGWIELNKNLLDGLTTDVRKINLV